MKIIFKIAKNELRYLFYSPIAWFVIVVFLIQCAVFFTNPVYDLAVWQDTMLKNSPKFTGFSFLTRDIFLLKGVFGNVIGNLYLFMPILTMGLISREINSGASKLLYSSPVRLRQVVLGKYVGIMLYNLLLVAILGIFLLSGIVSIKHADYGMLLSAALGFYLLVCAYSAIGLFMSALSGYQIVSALSTFIIIFVLSHISSLWQRYDLVRDLTWFLSLQDRIWKMLNGLIVTRDLIYFVIVSAMFIAFTVIKLKEGRESRPWYVKVGRYTAVIMVTLLTGYISSRPIFTGYFDTTASQANTIPEAMQKLIKDMGDSTLEITLYTNLLAPGIEHGLPEVRNADYLSTMWEPYLRYKPDMQFKYVYYYNNDPAKDDSALYKMYGKDKTLQQIAAETAGNLDFDLSFFKLAEQLPGPIHLEEEGYRLVMQLKYKGRTEWLRTFPDPFFWPDLNNVAAAFKRLIDPSAIPKIYFVTGELERSVIKTGDREYAFHTASRISRGALVNTGYDVDTLNLAKQDIPAGISALVLADPRMALSTVVLNKLKQYINTGGNIFIAGKPGKQNILNLLLQQLGVQLMPGQLVESTYDETPDKVQAYLTGNSFDLSEEMSALAKRLSSGDTLKVLMPGVTALSYKDSLYSVKPLLATVPGKTWLKAGDLVVDSTLPVFNSREGDIKQSSFTTALLLTKQLDHKEQRIAITGDADFASNKRLGNNAFFLMPVYSWISYNRFPVYMLRITPKDTLLNISGAAAKAQKIVFVWVLPGFVLLTGSILLIRRKRQ
jgi:ABC-2 type transport system permease protein